MRESERENRSVRFLGGATQPRGDVGWLKGHQSKSPASAARCGTNEPVAVRMTDPQVPGKVGSKRVFLPLVAGHWTQQHSRMIYSSVRHGVSGCHYFSQCLVLSVQHAERYSNARGKGGRRDNHVTRRPPRELSRDTTGT